MVRSRTDVLVDVYAVECSVSGRRVEDCVLIEQLLYLWMYVTTEEALC